MAISVVQSAYSTTAYSASFTSGTTAGNCVIACIIGYDTGMSISGVTLGGSAGNFASAVQGYLSADYAFSAIWVDPNCAGGQTAVAATVSATEVYGLYIFEVAGLVTSSVVDKTSGNYGSAATWTLKRHRHHNRR